MISYKVVFSLFITVISITAEYSLYSNANRTLFALPAYYSSGSSDIVFNRSGSALSNPATLPLSDENIIALCYAGYYQNVFSTTSAAVTLSPLEKLSIAFFSGYLYIPDIEITTSFNENDVTGHESDFTKLEYATSSELYTNFSLGYRIIDHRIISMALGANIHFMRRRLIDWTGYGFGVDIGAEAIIAKTGIRFSLLAEDITTAYFHWSNSYSENGKPHLRFGLGWERNIPYIYSDFKITYKSPDLFSNEGASHFAFSEDTDIQEQRVRKNLSLLITRGFYGIDIIIHNVVRLAIGTDDLKRLQFGGGLNLFNNQLSFDFAYLMSDLSGTYMLSTNYSWK